MRMKNKLAGSVRVRDPGSFRFPVKRVADLSIEESEIVWTHDRKIINFKINNKGSKSSGRFLVGIYAEQKDKKDKLLVKFQVSELKPNKSIEKTFNLMDVVSRYESDIKNLECLVVRVDCENNVKELHENNNSEFISIVTDTVLDYHPGEVQKHSEGSMRPKQWAIEWNEVNEDLDTKAYRSLFRAPYIQNVTSHSAVVVWRTIAELHQANARVTLWNETSGECIATYYTRDDEFSIEVLDVTSSYVYDNNDMFRDDDQLNIKGPGQYRPNLEYRVTFKGLDSNSLYSYRVEANGEAENGNLRTHMLAEKTVFKTAQEKGSNATVKFVAMGDFGQADDQPSYYYDVFDLFHDVVRERGVDYWLALGDLDNCTDGHPNAVDPFFFSVFNAYMDETPRKTSSLKVSKSTTVKAFRNPPYYGVLGGMPVYPTFGNHDIRYSRLNYDKTDKYSSWLQAYKSSYIFPATRADSWNRSAYEFNSEGDGFFYTYRYGNVITISLASPSSSNDYNQKVYDQLNVQYVQLKKYLEAIKDVTGQDDIWLVVFTHDHKLLYKNYKYNNDLYDYRKLFAHANVNIVLSGHQHFYEERRYLYNEQEKALTWSEDRVAQPQACDLFHFISGTGGYGDDDSSDKSPSKRPGFLSFEVKGNQLRYCKYDSHYCGSDDEPVNGRDGLSPRIIERGELTQRDGRLHYASCDSAVFEGDEYTPPSLQKYTISVETGDVDCAGTDADVFIRLIGSKKNSSFVQLDNNDDNFENSDKDSFSIMLEDLGDVNRIEIKHSNTGNKAGWFLEKVVVTQGGDRYNFTAQQWLSDSNDDVHPKISVREDSLRVKYNVTVKTADVKNAGTDASIYIQLFGVGGKSTPLQRIDNKNYDDFERGASNSYTVFADEHLGAVNSIKLEHANTGDGPWWKIDTVTVDDRYKFIINEWLGDDNKNIHPSKIFRM